MDIKALQVHDTRNSRRGDTYHVIKQRYHGGKLVSTLAKMSLLNVSRGTNIPDGVIRSSVAETHGGTFRASIIVYNLLDVRSTVMWINFPHRDRSMLLIPCR